MQNNPASENGQERSAARTALLTAARVLELTLTSRAKDATGAAIPMCGMPFHALDGYLSRLIKKGYRAAICEQVEDPKVARGIVKREVVRVVTPGVILEEEQLDPKAAHYLVAVVADGGRAGIAYLVTLPFKESLGHGLANLLIPFYAVYYWTTRWPKVKTAVIQSVGSFLPVLLVAIAYIVYKEAPAVEQRLEAEIPALEKMLDERVPALDRKVDQMLEPLEKKAGALAEPAPERAESPRTRGRSPGQGSPPF